MSTLTPNFPAGQFTLRDMYEQFQNIMKMGPFGQIMVHTWTREPHTAAGTLDKHKFYYSFFPFPFPSPPCDAFRGWFQVLAQILWVKEMNRSQWHDWRSWWPSWTVWMTRVMLVYSCVHLPHLHLMLCLIMKKVFYSTFRARQQRWCQAF